jgi:hypothetical protein
MEPITPGFVQATLQRLKQINKAPRKEGVDQGGVSLTYDLNNGFVSGSFIFPIEQIETADGSVVRAADFLEMPTTPDDDAEV